LDRIKDAISQSAHFEVTDLEMSPFTERGGSSGVEEALGNSVIQIIESMNMELAS
jgi:hypothetical protein